MENQYRIPFVNLTPKDKNSLKQSINDGAFVYYWSQLYGGWKLRDDRYAPLNPLYAYKTSWSVGDVSTKEEEDFTFDDYRNFLPFLLDSNSWRKLNYTETGGGRVCVCIKKKQGQVVPGVYTNEQGNKVVIL